MARSVARAGFGRRARRAGTRNGDATEIAAALERADIARGIELVARAAERGVLVASSCSAAFVLAASGVLDGREATTTWWLGPTFAQRFPRVTLRTDRMVVGSGRVLTAGSAFAHADLMLAILAQTLSPSLAHLVARYLVLDERASQARYMVTEHLRSADPVIRALERFIASNIHRQLTVAQMARATATSPRTLARRTREGPGHDPAAVRTALARRPGRAPARDHAGFGRRGCGSSRLRRCSGVPAHLPARNRRGTARATSSAQRERPRTLNELVLPPSLPRGSNSDARVECEGRRLLEAGPAPVHVPRPACRPSPPRC